MNWPKKFLDYWWEHGGALLIAGQRYYALPGWLMVRLDLRPRPGARSFWWRIAPLRWIFSVVVVLALFIYWLAWISWIHGSDVEDDE
jgi:hypothetical protein